ncbi:MAG: hypothetical protein JWO53_620 [Chlamydiia bacterium]|nr:hypothetical protein [Chlamydiia bacterium]
MTLDTIANLPIHCSLPKQLSSIEEDRRHHTKKAIPPLWNETTSPLKDAAEVVKTAKRKLLRPCASPVLLSRNINSYHTTIQHFDTLLKTVKENLPAHQKRVFKEKVYTPSILSEKGVALLKTINTQMNVIMELEDSLLLTPPQGLDDLIKKYNAAHVTLEGYLIKATKRIPELESASLYAELLPQNTGKKFRAMSHVPGPANTEDAISFLKTLNAKNGEWIMRYSLSLEHWVCCVVVGDEIRQESILSNNDLLEILIDWDLCLTRQRVQEGKKKALYAQWKQMRKAKFQERIQTLKFPQI